MKNSLKKVAIAVSMAASVGAIATAPAYASSLGQAAITGNDYIKYDSDKTNTFENKNATLATILTGDSSKPTGNVELFASSEKMDLLSFLNYNQATTLSGKIAGKNITLSSLTAADWFGADAAMATRNSLTSASQIADKVLNAQAVSTAVSSLYSESNLATRWFNQTLSQYGVTPQQDMFSAFVLGGGFQRFSDPNISYVNQDDQSGMINIGLAGHYNAKTLLDKTFKPNLDQMQASLTEVNTALTTATSARNLLQNNLNTANTALDSAKVLFGGNRPTTAAQVNAKVSLTPTQKTQLITAINASNTLPNQISLANTNIGTITTQKTQLQSKIDSFNNAYSKLPSTVQVSEVVKVAYNGNPAQYLYSYSATQSGLTEKGDGISHSGNYAVSIQGVVQKTVPEPSALLGILGVAGVFATQRKFNKLKKA
jgi:hypothetical protein